MLEDASTQRMDRALLGPERWRRLKEIFRGAQPLGEGERQAFLDRECGGDEELRREAVSLLAAGDASRDFLREPVSALAIEVLAQGEGGRAEGAAGPSAADKLRPGTLLGERYEIERELGSGNIGIVYLARDRRTKKLVAVKVLLEQSLRSELAVRMFRQEAEALARVGEHPGIVGVSDVGRLEGGGPYFVMQYVEGVTLREALDVRSKGLYLELVADILEQAAEALDTAHGHGILHRDLKPENIMLQRLREGREHVKIIDFGVAKVRDSEVMKSAIDPLFVGTPLYMSPEQLRREPPTAASDIYSLGVIVYETLMGRHPFGKPESAEELLKLQQHGAPVKPSTWRKGLPEEADRVIQSALSYDPAKRYPSARRFSDDLAWALFKTRPKARPVSVWAWAVVAAALIVVLGAAWWWQPAFVNRKPPDETAPPVVEGRNRQLTFGLTITRARDGRRTRVTGREMFDTGDIFRFDFMPGEPGALYLFNEGISGNWHVLFPTCENNRLDARLTPGRSFATKGYEFTNYSGREKGTEKIWLVWSAATVEPLDEIVRQSARGCPKPCEGCLTVNDSSQKETLSRFMIEHGEPRPEVRVDKEQGYTRLEGRGGILVHSLEMEHTDWK